MSVYIIAIGGTGARFAEAVAHLAAAGLLVKDNDPQDLQILFVDRDTGNGNLAAADKTLKIYQKCQEIVGGNKENLMPTKLEQLGVWSISNEIRLTDAFRYHSYGKDDPVKHLFDVFYTQQERDMDLKDGFKGRPGVGAAFMSQLKKKGDWDHLMDRIENDSNGGRSPKVFLCGSIFGGTGASGFPTLGRMIANDLGPDGKNVLDKVTLGGLLMLPYFQFTAPRKSNDEEIYARSEDFILKTEAALHYYNTQELGYDAVYLLGMPKSTVVDEFSTGGRNQRNQPHFLELYGALALRDYLFRSKSSSLEARIISRRTPISLIWDDIPRKDDVRRQLLNSARFAFAWRSSIHPDLNHARTSGRQQDYFWSMRFFNKQELNDNQEIDKIEAIKDWCEDYLRWLGNIHRSNKLNNEIELFKTRAFFEDNGELKNDRDEFPNLGMTPSRVKINKILGDLNPKKISDPNRKTIGLAKALYYTICKHQ